MNILEESKNIYFGKKTHSQNAERFEQIDTAYLFTNEIINGYMPDLYEKRILAVGGCGDHYFNARLNGASSVELFDINYLSKFIIALKKAGFEYLDYDVFCTFFGLYNIHKIFDYDIFQMFSKYLSDEDFIYWQHIYEISKQQGYSIYESELISKFHHHIEEIMASNRYFNEDEFLKLKQLLSNTPEITFYHADINELPIFLRGKYDSMFLSNISTYQNNTKFIKLLKKLARYLQENGEIYFAYIYSNISDKASFFDKLLQSSHYHKEEVPNKIDSCQNHKVYIYKK